MKTIFDKTKSPCPLCKKILEADIVEKNGSMFLQKKCPEHGDFEVKIAKYAWYYKGLNNYYDNLYGADFYKKKEVYPIYTAVINQKCNLNCPICSTSPLEKDGEDLPLNFFKEQLEKIKNKRAFIHLSGGGEPTLREDLPDLIRLITDSGNAASLFTNGIRISNDFNYLMELKKNGLKSIYVWLDTLKNEEVHRRLRGVDLIEFKMRALKNIKRAKIPTTIIQVVVKNINENEIGTFIDFVRKNGFISTLLFRSYSFTGEYGLSPSQEFDAIDEMVETAVNQNHGLFTIQDFYLWQKINYTLSAIGNLSHCYRTQSILIPRSNEKSLRDTFYFSKFSLVLDEFEKIWPEDPERAKKYFLSKCFLKLFKNPKLFHLYIKSRISKFGWSAYCQKYYCMIVINSACSLLNFDLNRAKLHCPNRSFNHGPEKNVSRCSEILGLSV